jgi:hypothetical protein
LGDQFQWNARRLEGVHEPDAMDVPDRERAVLFPPYEDAQALQLEHFVDGGAGPLGELGFGNAHAASVCSL